MRVPQYHSYITPVRFTKDRVRGFLYSIQSIFRGQVRQQKNAVLRLSKTKEMDITGMLVLYKLMDYTINHNCFYRPNIVIEETYIEERLQYYGFKELIVSMINDYDKKLDNKKYKNLKIGGDANFIIAPQALLRDETQSKDRIATKYMPDIKRYYDSDPKVVEMIFGCFSEMLLNFWEHAIADNRSVIVAEGNKEGINIVCADNGDGIISTLSNLPKYKNKSENAILRLAFAKNITSKERDPNHMGCGLWIIDQTVSRSKGEMWVFSEGWCYHNNQGKKRVIETGYWKGTIISVYLPTATPITMKDIMDIDDGLFAN